MGLGEMFTPETRHQHSFRTMVLTTMEIPYYKYNLNRLVTAGINVIERSYHASISSHQNNPEIRDKV